MYTVQNTIWFFIYLKSISCVCIYSNYELIEVVNTKNIFFKTRCFIIIVKFCCVFYHLQKDVGSKIRRLTKSSSRFENPIGGIQYRQAQGYSYPRKDCSSNGWRWGKHFEFEKKLFWKQTILNEFAFYFFFFFDLEFHETPVNKTVTEFSGISIRICSFAILL